MPCSIDSQTLVVDAQNYALDGDGYWFRDNRGPANDFANANSLVSWWVPRSLLWVLRIDEY